jgi:hypothetical protein
MSENANPFEGFSNEDIAALLADVKGRRGNDPADPDPAPASTPAAAEPPKFEIEIGGRKFTGSQEDIQTAIATEENRLRANAPPARTERKVTAEESPYDVSEVRSELTRLLQEDPVKGIQIHEQACLWA